MNISDLATALESRIGFVDDKTVSGLTLSAANLASDSGRDFQSEHSAITLENIRSCQPVKQISEIDFNEYLTRLRKQCIKQVLDDAFERDHIEDTILTRFPRAFDTAISLRMVIVIGELIMTSTRSNKIERFTDAFVGKLNYDIFREAPNKFAIRGANYNYTLGVATRYGFEIESLQRRFGSQRNMIKSITKSEVFNQYIADNHSN